MAILASKLLLEAGFVNAFPEREVSDAALRAVLGIPRIVQARQVHGAGVLEVDGDGAVDAASGVAPSMPAPSAAAPGVAEPSAAGPTTAPSVGEADAVVARGDGRLAVGIRVADCVPLLVADAVSGDVAAIHAGWRGVVAGVVAAGVRRLSGAELIAAIGPCIGACCFEVGRDVAQSIARACIGVDVVVRASGEKAFVDLRRAVRAQLVAEGLDPERIEDVAGCTKHEPSRFHSFRRDGADSGRMLAAVATRARRNRAANRRA